MIELLGELHHSTTGNLAEMRDKINEIIEQTNLHEEVVKPEPRRGKK
jgi:hypothetical protein